MAVLCCNARFAADEEADFNRPARLARAPSSQILRAIDPQDRQNSSHIKGSAQGPEAGLRGAQNMSGKDTLGFLTESTILPKAPRSLGVGDAGMAGLKAATSSASSATSSLPSSSSTSSATAAIMERLKAKKAAGGAAAAVNAKTGSINSNAGVLARAAKDEEVGSKGGEPGAPSKGTSTLEDKARLYAVLSGSATPHETLSFARHLLTLPSSSSFPPSIRQQVAKAAGEAGLQLGLDVRREFAPLTTISGAKRMRQEQQAGDDEDAAEDAEEHGDASSSSSSSSLAVDFEYKRLQQQHQGEQATKKARREAEEAEEKHEERELPSEFLSRAKETEGRKPAPPSTSSSSSSASSSSSSSSSTSLAFLAGYEAARKLKQQQEQRQQQEHR